MHARDPAEAVEVLNLLLGQKRQGRGQRAFGVRFGRPRASYSAAADRGLRPRRFGGAATTSGVDTTASCGLRPRPIRFAIVERRSE
jgi:hypothetical protein